MCHSGNKLMTPCFVVCVFKIGILLCMTCFVPNLLIALHTLIIFIHSKNSQSLGSLNLQPTALMGGAGRDVANGLYKRKQSF